MRRFFYCMVAILTVVFGATSCLRLPKVTTEELEQIIQRDGVAFDVQSIPEEILNRLASNRVVLVGETHFIREHRELMAELIRELHARGFRQILVEWTQVADWLLADFVNDGGLEPDWAPPSHIFAGAISRTIRDFNRTLPAEEHFQIHAIDVTLPDYGGGESFLWSLGRLAEHLPDPGAIPVLLEGDYDTLEQQQAKLESLEAWLEANRSNLAESWGEGRFDLVVEMVEVEIASASIRAMRSSNYDKSVRLREDAMKRIADRRLEEYPHGTLINVGSTHAQKERLRGTKIEWLGDYLAHKSQAAGESVIVLEVSAAQIVSVPGSGIADSDLEVSPENELFRVITETWPDRIVFLPVDDPVFTSKRIPMNFEGTIYWGAPKKQYDVFVLLPLAHRVPLEP
ncbi:hypothetical protein ACFLSG_04325 [Candidatus Bipolaricaulota bacterium]